MIVGRQDSSRYGKPVLQSLVVVSLHSSIQRYSPNPPGSILTINSLRGFDEVMKRDLRLLTLRSSYKML